MAQPIDIPIRVIAELDAVQDVVGALEGIEQVPENLRKSFEKLYSVPEELDALTRKYSELREKVESSKATGDEGGLRIAEQELGILQRKIELEEKLLRIRMDSTSVFAQELIPQIEAADISAETRGEMMAMVTGGVDERTNTLRQRYSLLEAGVDITKAESRLARSEMGGESGEGGAAPVKWGALQSLGDEIVREITRTVTGALRTGLGMGLDRAMGGSSLMGIVQNAISSSEMRDILGSPVGAALGLGAGSGAGEAFWSGMEGFRQRTSLTPEQIASMAGGATGWFTGSSRELAGALSPLWGLTQFGLSPDSAAQQGRMASLLTGGEGTGAGGQGALMDAIIPILRAGNVGGRGLESRLQMAETFAEMGAARSGSFGSEELANTAAMPGFFFEGTNYENFMLSNPQNATRFMQQLSAPFEGKGGDATNAFLMRAYGYKGGGLSDYADFMMRVQQGFTGEGGFDNLKDVMDRLSLESGTKDPKSLALQMSNITGINMSQLMPMIEKMQSGDYEGAKDKWREDFAYDPSKAQATDTAKTQAEVEGRKSQVGDPLLDAIRNLATVIGQLFDEALPTMIKGIEALNKGIDKLNLNAGKEELETGTRAGKELASAIQESMNKGTMTEEQSRLVSAVQTQIDKGQTPSTKNMKQLYAAFGIEPPEDWFEADEKDILNPIAAATKWVGRAVTYTPGDEAKNSFVANMPISQEARSEQQMRLGAEQAIKRAGIDIDKYGPDELNVRYSGKDERGRSYVTYGNEDKSISINIPLYIDGDVTKDTLKQLEQLFDGIVRDITSKIKNERRLDDVEVPLESGI